jgi:parvulin-like peptidyl-prolyl isomerase
LSGEAAPALPADAPKSVVFGVVLVTYRGAQGPPGAARVPATARSREAALEMAKQLAELAKTDFKAAVGKGDKPGSMDNAGRIPRGVLEPAPEYVLFSLPKGGVSEPVDTPRGYWIVQRIE